MWGQLVVDSLVRPRAAARRVLAAHLPLGELAQAAVMVTCAGMVLLYFAFRLMPGPVDAFSAALLGSPLIGAVTELGAMAVGVVLIVRVGRLFGGGGEVSGALALVVWLNAVLVLLEALQIVTFLLVPPLAAVLAIATAIWLLWALANFVAELHGFLNPMFVLGGVILTMIVLFFAVAILLAFLGVAVPEGQ